MCARRGNRLLPLPQRLFWMISWEPKCSRAWWHFLVASEAARAVAEPLCRAVLTLLFQHRYVELVKTDSIFEPHESFFTLFSDPRSTRLARIHLREQIVQDQDLEAIRKQVVSHQQQLPLPPHTAGLLHRHPEIPQILSFTGQIFFGTSSASPFSTPRATAGIRMGTLV